MTTHTPAPDGDLPEIPAHQLESALRGHRPLHGAPDVNDVADLMNALKAPAERAELGGYHRAMNAFGATFTHPSTRSRRIAMIISAVGIKALATGAGAAVALGAVATVILASGSFGPHRQVQVLPVATTSTSSPAKTSEPKATEDDETMSGDPVGPDASGPAAFGLCNAWSKNPDRATSDQSVAHRNLARAAGGEGKIAAYCATIPHPGPARSAKSAAAHAKSGKAAKPAHPAKPPHPAKPEHPTEPAHPAKHAHPAKPAKPTEPTLRSTTTTTQ